MNEVPGPRSLAGDPFVALPGVVGTRHIFQELPPV